MIYLGLDYGKAKVGVALATGSLAEPLTTIKTEKALQVIKQLLDKHNIDSIVVGNCPESFLDNLSGLVVVHQVDETLSSHDAREGLLHTTQKRRQELEHAAAATIILQNWLDYHD